MQKCVIIPDSFKGTISSAEVCEIMKEAVHSLFPACRAITVPVADGGEGTVDCFLAAMQGEKKYANVSGPYFEEIKSFYGKCGDAGVVEMASAAGLPLVSGRLNPERTTTYGVGQLMNEALLCGCKKLVVGLGGSCTNDAGAGAAAALGVSFYNQSGKSFVPAGGTLDQVRRIDTSKVERTLSGIELVAMCDIQNPMYGENGAAYVYAPQKGADPEMVKRLDEQLRAFSETIKRELGLTLSDLPGGGAAGAMGAGLFALLGAKLESGMEIILNMIRFDELLIGCDAVLTGEGAIDFQSADGKVLSGVGRAAERCGVPVFALTGKIGEGAGKVHACGITDFRGIHPKGKPVVLSDSKEHLFLATTALLREKFPTPTF